MTDKLKPCPFCGGQAKLFNTRVQGGYDYSYVQCLKCSIHTAKYDVSVNYCSSEKATEAWNRRADNG